MRNLTKSLCLPAASAFITAASAQTIRVACVGDSINFGATLTNRVANACPAPLGRWPGAGCDTRNFGRNDHRAAGAATKEEI